MQNKGYNWLTSDDKIGNCQKTKPKKHSYKKHVYKSKLCPDEKLCILEQAKS